MTRGPVHSLLACALVSLLAAGCSSPWPPEGGERPGAFPDRVAQPVPPGDNETLLDYVREVAINLEGRELELPGQSQAVCAQALKRAADDDLDGLRALLAPVAAFGLVPRSNLPYDRDPRRFEPRRPHPRRLLCGDSAYGQRHGISGNGATAIGCGRDLPCRIRDPRRRTHVVLVQGRQQLRVDQLHPVTTAEGPRISYVSTTPAMPRTFPARGVAAGHHHHPHVAVDPALTGSRTRRASLGPRAGPWPSRGRASPSQRVAAASDWMLTLHDRREPQVSPDAAAIRRPRVSGQGLGRQRPATHLLKVRCCRSMSRSRVNNRDRAIPSCPGTSASSVSGVDHPARSTPFPVGELVEPRRQLDAPEPALLSQPQRLDLRVHARVGPDHRPHERVDTDPLHPLPDREGLVDAKQGPVELRPPR